MLVKQNRERITTVTSQRMANGAINIASSETCL